MSKPPDVCFIFLFSHDYGIIDYIEDVIENL